MSSSLTQHIAAQETARNEFADRVKGEQQKAVEKYGQVALAPCGHPDFDVLDYAINEIVGLVRYAEIIGNRVSALRDAYPDQVPGSRVLDAHSLASEISEFAKIMGPDLIALRNKLLSAGVSLGATERR